MYEQKVTKDLTTFKQSKQMKTQSLLSNRFNVWM